MAFLTPAATGEAAVLRNFITNQFAQVRSTAFGLTDEQLHARSTVSDFTTAALLDHVGAVAEQYGVGIEAAGSGAAEYNEGMTEGAAEPVEGRAADDLLAGFDRRVSAFSDLLARVEAGEIALDAHVPVPSAPWFPPHLTYWEVRWVLNHVATETARHAGHADIIRESIDGKQSYELNDLADGNEVRDWTASAE